MLTEIFARRYADVPLWETFTEPSRRLIAQGHQLLEQLFPYWTNGKVSQSGERAWTELHSRMARELGVKELSPSAWAYKAVSGQWASGVHATNKVCETWMLAQFDRSSPADQFIKERLSLVEIGFRIREGEVTQANARLPQEIAEAEEMMSTHLQRRGGTWLPGNRVEGVKAQNATTNALWKSAVTELNARFQQAECQLHYHNGFIQIESDETTVQQVTAPFWKLVADPIWQNVDQDMKEAIDLRDTDGRDPSFYAAKALESVVKIISDKKELSSGKERGAASYIDNLMHGRVLEGWEADALKTFFAKIRNPLGHGPGSGTMPTLNRQQTDWAIETCMSWAKSLIRRV